MAQFQLPPSVLFPGGTPLFTSGNSGAQRLVLQTGKQATLVLTGVAPSAKPTVRQVPLQNIADLLGFISSTLASSPDVLTISPLAGGGTKRTFTIKGTRPGLAALLADDAQPLAVVVGDFVNHPGFEKDLIADVFRDSDPAKSHVLTRMLFSNVDNLFNEESTDNQRHWCEGWPARGCLPCGTVAKVGSAAVFRYINYDYQTYNKPLTGMTTPTARAALKREDVKYEEAKLKRACQAIKKRLMKGLPSIMGLVYIPSSAVLTDGTFEVTTTGGHSVPIVGCDVDATKFLYIDVYQEGSKLKYLGGHAGRDLFPAECNYLGVFEWTDDPVRGCPVLRARPGTAGPSNVFSGDQFLEVVSGPLTG
jgi:hypothetical protein